MNERFESAGIRDRDRGASQRVAVFRAQAPIFSKKPYVTWILQVSFQMFLQLSAVELLHGEGSILVRALPLVGGLAILGFFLIPTRITMGADGVELRWLWQKRFLRYQDLSRAVTYDTGGRFTRSKGIELLLASGKSIRLAISGDRAAHENASRLSERIEAALADRQASSPESVTARLGREGRDISAWVRSLRSLGAGANASMRVAPVPRDRLFVIVEDAAMDPAARAAAAVALGPELDDDGRARLRVASNAIAAPKLRVAIARAAETGKQGDDAAVEAALAEVEAEGENRLFTR